MGNSENKPGQYVPTSIASAKQIYTGVNAHQHIAQYCLELQISKSIMLVTDPGIKDLGLHLSLLDALKVSGFQVVIFAGVVADPSQDIVLEAAEVALKNQVSGIIGFGGGSSLDVAKMAALLGHKNSMDTLPDCYGVGANGAEKVKGSRLPLIQIPTTAGTGSELTPVAIITTGGNMKNACVSKKLIADIVVLDPVFTFDLPEHITTATGMDAMVHALEAYTSKIKKNVISDGLAKQALELLSNNVLKVAGPDPVLEKAEVLQARENMLIGSMLAGQAFANAPVGAVHALAYPLGGYFHIPHGNSNALVLVEVMKFNLPCAIKEYAQLAGYLLPEVRTLDEEGKARSLIRYFVKLLETLKVPTRLSDYGIEQSQLPKLADSAMQQTRLLQNNPRPVTWQGAFKIYQALL